MENPRSIFISWLNDALDEEYSYARLLGEHIDQLNDSEAELREKLISQMGRSQDHADRLGNIIVQIGGKIGKEGVLEESTKTALLGLARSLSSDKLKMFLDERALEQGLLARYSILVNAAKYLDERELAVNLETLLEEKKASSVWFEENLQEVVKEVLA